MHYLDNAATTRVSEAAANAAYAAMREDFGNPSSVHRMGVLAEGILDRARADVAAGLGCDPAELTFTGSGTESDNWAIFSGAEYGKRRGNHIVTTAVEHAAVLSSAKRLSELGFDVTILPATRGGSVDLGELEGALRPDTILLSMMAVNNETGVPLPVREAGELLRRTSPDALFHVDAVQAFLKCDLSPKGVGADLLSISAHKIHGPKGIGALYIRNGLRLKPFVYGGGQEAGLRSGTEAVPLAAGFGAAVAELLPTVGARRKAIDALRERLLAGLADVPGATLLAAANTVVNFAFSRYPAEVTIRMLEREGIYVSGGSACSKGRQSHVLRAMGIDSKLVASALRVSFGFESTEEDVDALLTALRTMGE